MSRRAVWRGYVSFGLVSIPVKLFSATQSKQVHFRQFDPETGERVRYKRVTEHSQKEIAYEDIAKGYEIARGEYVLLSAEELESVEPGPSRTIDIEDFIELDDVDPIFFNKTYHLAPADESSARPYKLLHTAMERANRVAVGRFVMRSKEYLAGIRPSGDILVLETMFFEDEVRAASGIDEVHLLSEGRAAGGRELGVAEQLIGSLSAKWDPGRYRDRYRERVLDLVERKAEGKRVVTEKPEEPSPVVDLMGALEASVAAARQRKEGSDGSRLAGKSKEELYAEAQRRNIPGRSSMSKEELASALREAS